MLGFMQVPVSKHRGLINFIHQPYCYCAHRQLKATQYTGVPKQSHGPYDFPSLRCWFIYSLEKTPAPKQTVAVEKTERIWGGIWVFCSASIFLLQGLYPLNTFPMVSLSYGVGACIILNPDNCSWTLTWCTLMGIDSSGSSTHYEQVCTFGLTKISFILIWIQGICFF